MGAGNCNTRRCRQILTCDMQKNQLVSKIKSTVDAVNKFLHSQSVIFSLPYNEYHHINKPEAEKKRGCIFVRYQV